MKEGDIVIAPKVWGSYLTEGKEYKVINTDGINYEIFGYYFDIIDDNGKRTFCTEKQSAHLGFQDWILKEEPFESTSKKIKQSLLRLYLEDCEQTIKSEKIIEYVKQEIGTEYKFGDTILRMLRQLRQDGNLDYIIDGAKQERNYKFKKI